MSTRPEYYSGRGAITCDLNSDMLFGIHKDIIEVYGEDAGKEFVKMVDAIKVISATAFLNALYELYYNNWECKMEKQPDSITVAKKKDGTYDETSGMMGIISAMFSSGRDQTNEIKSWFLLQNGVEPKEEIYYNDRYGYVSKWR